MTEPNRALIGRMPDKIVRALMFSVLIVSFTGLGVAIASFFTMPAKYSVLVVFLLFAISGIQKAFRRSYNYGYYVLDNLIYIIVGIIITLQSSIGAFLGVTWFLLLISDLVEWIFVLHYRIRFCAWRNYFYDLYRYDLGLDD